jgi:hypothetical protein
MNHHYPSLLSLLLFFLSVGVISSFSPGAFLRQLASSSAITSFSPTENNFDNDNTGEYPWSFTGRLWFRPSLVRIPSDPITPPSGVSIVSLFGWTLGGTVALEYDDSPIGPYLEYVTMGALVSKRGALALGQWGSRLYVSTEEAERVCQEIWNVPAESADITFVDDDDDDDDDQGISPRPLSVESAPDSLVTGTKQRITVGGWSNTRVLTSNEAKAGPKRSPSWGLPVFWTPTIKALWAPVVVPLPLPGSDHADKESITPLPRHRLRLSASALRLTRCGQSPSKALGIPLGIGLVVDNVLIEISRQDGDL